MAPRFGLMLSKQHPPDASAERKFLEHVEQVRLARALGLESLWAGQHYLSSYLEFQQMPLLARLAADAEGMEIGTCILLLPLAHPLVVAEEAATLDAMTGGRFLLGVGLGYRELEFQALGVPRRERVPRFEEAVQIIRRLWTEESVTFRGRHFQLEDARLTLRPVRQPHPPILIGADTESAVRRAALLGDAWLVNPDTPFAALAKAAGQYRAALEEVGKPFPDNVTQLTEVYVDEDAERAAHDVRPYLENKYRAYAQWGRPTFRADVDPASLPFEELPIDRFVVGDPRQCADKLLRSMREVGVNHFACRLQWPGMPQEQVLRNLDLFAREVVPLVRAA
jgi:alkanesulfonate monooxygenase SsuD/methylene tetrahydromethanopterin reductase-like flavin-dependent oxidoreductase (luciferase family)